MDRSALLTLLEDLNACGSEALDTLRENRLGDVRQNIQALLDAVRDGISDLEDDA